MRVQHLLFLAVFGLLAACAGKKNVDENLSERELYEKAQSDLDRGRYSTAIPKLKALESRYLFVRHAEQSQLELMHAYYKTKDHEAAVATADRFIRLHPQHPNVDYAYYMKGLAAFDQDRGFLSRFLPLDMTQRDPGATRDSYNEFARLVSRFPHSAYAPDAKQRMVYARNLLADYEIHAGRYYVKRKAYVAAANRGRYVVENFQGSPAVPDGLALMVQNYRTLGLDDLADKSLETLQLNYPEHASLRKGKFVASTPRHTSSRSWLNKASLGLLGKNTAKSKPPRGGVITQADKEMQRQLRDAKDNIPKDIRKDAGFK